MASYGDEPDDELDPDLIQGIFDSPIFHLVHLADACPTDMPQPGNSFGNSFGNELADLDTGLDSNDPSNQGPPTPTRSRGSFEEESTPQRRGNAAGSNNRHSLAFELAAAMSPEQTTSSRLLEELGIEQGIEEEEEESADEEGTESVVGSDAAATNGLHAPSPVRDPRHLMPSPRRPATAKASVMSLRSVSAQSYTSQSANAVDDSFDFDEADAAFAAASSALQDSLQTTDRFLEHIHRFTSSSSGSDDQAGLGDRQQLLERQAGDVIRRILDVTKEREAQVRELREMERAFAGKDLELLAELDDLELEGPPPLDDEMAQGEKLDMVPEESESDPQTPTRPRASSSSWSASSSSLDYSAGLSASTQLSQLRSLTGQLVSTLGSINEHTQLSRGATSEAGRKLRALKGVIGGWKGELESVDRSEEYIRRWEEEEARSQAVDANGERRKGRYAERAFGEMREAERLLGDAYDR
jgi:hypothetical protein